MPSSIINIWVEKCNIKTDFPKSGHNYDAMIKLFVKFVNVVKNSV